MDNPGDAEIKNFGLTALDSNGNTLDYTANIPAGEWVEFSITKADLLAKGVDITALTFRFVNYDSGYTNRTVFYVDDVKLS